MIKVLVLFSCLLSFEAFLIRRTPRINRQVCFSSFEYEYLPPNPDASPEEIPSHLTSAYPEGTPAGLRGEAVRSALRSGQCVGWQLTSDPYLSGGGMLKIQGKGVKDFLNNKLTQEFSSSSASTFKEACLLDGKGRTIDFLKVALVDDETALVLTSPGHSSQKLLDRLSPFVFPLDRIELSNLSDAFTFSLASVQWNDIETAMQTEENYSNKKFPFPRRADQCQVWDWDSEGTKVLVVPSIGLPSQCAVGFTFAFFGNDNKSRVEGESVWKFLVGESNKKGPVAIGALEYETLRIEAGIPAFGREFATEIKASPFELHMQDVISMEKGCYLGQEGVASVLKNPRGPPRTLYAVVFDDDFNTYETQSRGDGSKTDNQTKPPKPGDTLYALGSNEELKVGALTSVAEARGTGKRNIVGLVLVRRADSVMKQMKELDLEIFREPEVMDDAASSDGIIAPPPLDPLDGLEVIVGGSFTTGRLKMVPSRGVRKGRNMFDNELELNDYFDASPVIQGQPSERTTESKEEQDDKESQAEIKKAEEEAEAAAAEARRKAEKMEMLKKRAEEALARRKKNQGN